MQGCIQVTGKKIKEVLKRKGGKNEPVKYLSQMRTKSLHLKGKIFFKSEGAHPPHTPPFK